MRTFDYMELCDHIEYIAWYMRGLQIAKKEGTLDKSYFKEFNIEFGYLHENIIARINDIKKWNVRNTLQRLFDALCRFCIEKDLPVDDFDRTLNAYRLKLNFFIKRVQFNEDSVLSDKASTMLKGLVYDIQGNFFKGEVANVITNGLKNENINEHQITQLCRAINLYRETLNPHKRELCLDLIDFLTKRVNRDVSVYNHLKDLPRK